MRNGFHKIVFLGEISAVNVAVRSFRLFNARFAFARSVISAIALLEVAILATLAAVFAVAFARILARLSFAVLDGALVF